jgi:N6-adenosine-specific RNA methylase IME4
MKRTKTPAPRTGHTVTDLAALAELHPHHFAVIYADPAWTYTGGQRTRGPKRHYQLMSLADIKALPVAKLARRDAVLLLWTPGAHLEQAMAVITAWGFRFKGVGFVWVKPTIGMGHWTRVQSELCLLATRGHPKRLAKDVEQVVCAPAGIHSAKPEEVRRRIERLCAGPYLELFGRHWAPGWTVWGNQVRNFTGIRPNLTRPIDGRPQFNFEGGAR